MSFQEDFGHRVEWHVTGPSGSIPCELSGRRSASATLSDSPWTQTPSSPPRSQDSIAVTHETVEAQVKAPLLRHGIRVP
ncbi:hypothetical protein D7X74_08625 [Corallococcus sp. CA047B]|uniref:hypothetical protein n=1 Tax=Corallococcus sp. CA047B TaxID=2316729 RepID=UPI000EA2C64A|nr:hypothetical protein [Corallococcus sp. CA047B]RKH18748.1 hypothetical protein D7X74_08625 [Corallococcus sp. CA047B]